MEPAPAKRTTLASVTRGPIYAPARILIYGQPGVGKSTLACSAPDSIVIQGERGTEQINTARFPAPEVWSDITESVQTLIDEEHQYKNLVVDTADGLEGILFADICREGRVASIELVGRGYGKGYNRAVERWREFVALLERLRARKGMTVTILAHSMVKGFTNPEGSDFDRYIPKMNEKGWGVFFEWCDAVLFAQYEIITLGTDPTEKSKTVSSGARFLRTAKRAAWEAKNRYGFPESIPIARENGWAPLADYIAAPKRLRAEIESELARAPAELAKAVRAWLVGVGENALDLQHGLENLRARLTSTATN